MRRATENGAKGLLAIALMASLLGPSDVAVGQGRFFDVTVTVVKDKIVALPAGGSSIEEGLTLGETVVKTESKGQTGFAQTSSRLLAFSSELRRWADVALGSDERVERHHVLPRSVVVQSDRQLYGFQEGRAHWTNEPLGTGEKVKQLHGRGHVTVAITTDRALAFSAFTGGFFSMPLSNDEAIVSVDGANDAVLLRTSSRTIAFRSQTTDWTEIK
ncbi:MAG TPA: hypothetical protein VJ746_18615 [Nitrospira sp.]|nr:hypothetical protein [Nitrospira sp.]